MPTATPSTTGADARPAAGSATPSSPLAVTGALVSIALVAAVLRPALTSLGPLVERIDAELGMGSTALGVLGSLPVLCFAIVSAGVHAPAKRFGAERVVVAALIVLGVGLGLRFLPGAAPLWVGTALVGVGIAVGNVLLPSITKRWFPRRVSVVSGVYTSVLVIFAALGSGLAVPIADAAGGQWRMALGASLPVVLIGVVWWSVRTARRAPAAEASGASEAQPEASGAANTSTHAELSSRPAETSVWRSPTAWFVTAYMGLQSFGFYVTVTWLPSIEREFGVAEAASGWHLSMAQVVGMVVGMLCSVVMGRYRDQRWITPVPALFVIAGCAGLFFAGGTLPALWAALLGAGQGSSLVVALALMALRTSSAHDTSRLSGMSQSLGYGLAAVGPFLAGGLHDLSGSWLPVVAALFAAAVVQGLAGYWAGRDVVIGRGRGGGGAQASEFSGTTDGVGTDSPGSRRERP